MKLFSIYYWYNIPAEYQKPFSSEVTPFLYEQYTMLHNIFQRGVIF